MVIEGTNLMRTKRAYIAYLTYCSQKAVSASDISVKEYWDPEIKATEELLKAVEENLKRSEVEITG